MISCHGHCASDCSHASFISKATEGVHPLPGFCKVGEGWRAAGRAGKLAPPPCPSAVFHSSWHHPLYLWLVINSCHLVLQANPTSWLHSGIRFLGRSLTSLHMCGYYWNSTPHSRILDSKLAFCSASWLGGGEDSYPSPKLVLSISAWRASPAALNAEDEKHGLLGEPRWLSQTSAHSRHRLSSSGWSRSLCGPSKEPHARLWTAERWE